MDSDLSNQLMKDRPIDSVCWKPEQEVVEIETAGDRRKETNDRKRTK
jgi:hypothetical protein